MKVLLHCAAPRMLWGHLLHSMHLCASNSQINKKYPFLVYSIHYSDYLMFCLFLRWQRVWGSKNCSARRLHTILVIHARWPCPSSAWEAYLKTMEPRKRHSYSVLDLCLRVKLHCEDLFQTHKNPHEQNHTRECNETFFLGMLFQMRSQLGLKLFVLVLR